MPPRKGMMFLYSETDMENAIEECKQGSPIATAAKKFGVPRITLLNKVKGKTPIKRKMGRTCYITDEVENVLVTWAKDMSKQGFSIGKDNLMDSVKKIVDDLNVTTPFKNGRPGLRWYQSFLKRHPDVITKRRQKLPSSKPCVTPKLENWFEQVSMYLNNSNHCEILNQQRRIFNMEEVAFYINPKGNKVLATKREHSLYQKTIIDEEYYTVLLGGNAVGEVLPPMVIFKYARIPRELSKSVPETWSIARSDSGWMTADTFYDYICLIFNKWLDENNVPKPILLFINGHTSHISFHVSKFCSENGIVLIALHPDSLHILQPMNVTVFKSLKGAWKAALNSWRLENIDSPKLNKTNFCPLLNKILTDTLTPEIFENGFQRCGLSPWNPQGGARILEPSISRSAELTRLQKMAKIQELEQGKTFLDRYIDTEKIIKENIGLLEFYNKVKESLNNLKTEIKKEQNSGVECSNSLTDGSKILLDLPSNNNTTEKLTPITKIINYNSIDVTLDSSTGEFKIPNKQENATVKHFSNDIEMIIQSSFKRAWSWSTPNEAETKKRKKKLSSVLSSIQWKRYHKNKKKKKDELDKEKIRIIKERSKKNGLNKDVQQLKIALKLDKTCQMDVEKETENNDYTDEIYLEEEWLLSDDSIFENTDD